MKSLKNSLCRLGVAAAIILPAFAASAQTNAYDDALHYTKQTWLTNNLNDGFGFSPWVFTTSGPNSHGYFTTRDAVPTPAISSPTNFSTGGSPPGNDNHAHVWGMFANGGSAPNFNSAVAYRGFSNSLDTSVVFKLQWENLGIGNTINNLGGFVLRNGNATNATSDLLTGARFAFYFVGGSSNSFSYLDATGAQFIGIPFTSAALSCEFTLEPGDTYRLVIRNVATGTILAIRDGQPLAGSGTIDSVALFANQTSANQDFNRMQIVSASLTPPTIVNIQPTNGAVYVDPGVTNVSFEVDSVASSIATNGVSLVLNGVAQTNYLFNTTTSTNALLVTNNTPLAPNTVYAATIIANDANGNRATNTFTFNTFLQTDNFIEAEDYNFGGGQFIANSFPDAFGAYANLAGTSGVDFLDTSATNLNTYRSADATQILAGNDPVDHASYSANDFYIGFTDIGDWQDYTRVLPAGTYKLYARMAGFGTTPVMELERLASPNAVSTDQPNAALGRFVSPGGGTAAYTFVPLTDVAGNTVVLDFEDTNTLRCTAVGSSRSYNFNYLIVVPSASAGTLRPYLSVATPAAAATGVQLDSAISFSVANRDTTINPGSVQVTLNGSNITSALTTGNNAAGSTFTYVPPTLLTPNSTYTLNLVYADSGSVSMTNTWQFTTLNAAVIVIPAADAKPIGSAGTNGFALTIFKADDAAATTSTIANAEQELAGTRLNPNNNQPYTNVAAGPNGDGSFLETGVINYDIQGVPTGTPQFNFKSPFPYIAANAQNNNIAMQSLMYLALNPGFYHFAVRSDDGFKLTVGPTVTDTNLVLGLFDGGRGNGAASDIYFQVLTNGLYPMRLLYFQAGSGGNVEFYSINSGSVAVLINDSTNVNSIKAYASLVSVALPVSIQNAAHIGNVTTFSFVTQSNRTHFVEFKDSLDDAAWSPLQTVNGDGLTAHVTDNTASVTTRFYRVRTQ